MNKRLLFGALGSFAIGVIAWAIPPLKEEITREHGQRNAELCVAANMTWTPEKDLFGRVIAIRCNPDMPMVRAKDKPDAP